MKAKKKKKVKVIFNPIKKVDSIILQSIGGVKVKKYKLIGRQIMR